MKLQAERQREQISLKDCTYSKISGKRSEIKGLKTEKHSPSHALCTNTSWQNSLNNTVMRLGVGHFVCQHKCARSAYVCVWVGGGGGRGGAYVCMCVGARARKPMNVCVCERERERGDERERGGGLHIYPN